jgi:hypothetical protein
MEEKRQELVTIVTINTIEGQGANAPRFSSAAHIHIHPKEHNTLGWKGGSDP